jgi:SHS2 domain-containing protein
LPFKQVVEGSSPSRLTIFYKAMLRLRPKTVIKKYEIINHTADIGIKAYGKDLKHLFENAAFGLFNIISDTRKVSPKEPFGLELKAPNTEELLVSWLRELLFHFSTKDFIFCKFDIVKITPTSLAATCMGEKLDRQKHELKAEVKAVTYHDLKIEKIKKGFQASIIFDI